MGSNLRIVDVGKNILQFKFNSKYQKEWVERNSSVGNKSILVWKIKGNTQKEKEKRAEPEKNKAEKKKGIKPIFVPIFSRDSHFGP